MYAASIDFLSLSQTCDAGCTFLLCAMGILLPVLFLGWAAYLGKMSGQTVRFAQDDGSRPVAGEYRIARDGRAYVQVGRVCHFGRKGETESSLRARLADRGVL